MWGKYQLSLRIWNASFLICGTVLLSSEKGCPRQREDVTGPSRVPLRETLNMKKMNLWCITTVAESYLINSFLNNTYYFVISEEYDLLLAEKLDVKKNMTWIHSWGRTIGKLFIFQVLLSSKINWIDMKSVHSQLSLAPSAKRETIHFNYV